MNEARVANFTLIGAFVLMLCVYLFIIQYTHHVVGIEPVSTTVSAFCG